MFNAKTLLAGAALLSAGSIGWAQQTVPGSPGSPSTQPGQPTTINRQGTLGQAPSSVQPPGNLQATNQQQRSGTASTASQNMDDVLRTWLIAGNRNEISAAKLAKDRAKSDDVKKFADHMIEQHQKFLSKLEGAEGSYSHQTGQQTTALVPRNTQPGQPTQVRGQNDTDDQATESRDKRANDDASADSVPSASNRPTQPGTSGTVHGQQSTQGVAGNSQQTGQAGTSASANSGEQGQFIQLINELGQQCQQSAQAELTKREGAEFDKCYLGMQIGEHMKMVDTLKVFSRHASPQLASVLREGEQTTQSHLEEAKKLMKQIEEQDHRTAGRSSNQER